MEKKKAPPQVLHCLLSANRWEKLEEIQEADKKNSILIMNRYYQSNLVYGMVNEMKSNWLENLDLGLPKADLVIVLDVSPNESFNRKKTKRDQFEKNKKFMQKIRRTYHVMARKKNWKIVEASNSKEQVHKDIMKIFAQKLGL